MPETLEHRAIPTVRLFECEHPGADADVSRWGGNLTPMPLSAFERSWMSSLVMLMQEREALNVCLQRLESQLIELKSKMDPTTRIGLEGLFFALAMLQATRPATDSDDFTAKNMCASALGNFRDIQVALVLEACMGLDAPEDCPWRNPDLLCAAIAHRDLKVSEDERSLHKLALDASECRLYRELGRMWRDQETLFNAISRLSFFRDAFGLGLGMDPDLIAGLWLALDALVLLYAARPAATKFEARQKSAIVTDHHCRGSDHVGAVLAALLHADCVALNLKPCDLA